MATIKIYDAIDEENNIEVFNEEKGKLTILFNDENDSHILEISKDDAIELVDYLTKQFELDKII